MQLKIRSKEERERENQGKCVITEYVIDQRIPLKTNKTLKV